MKTNKNPINVKFNFIASFIIAIIMSVHDFVTYIDPKNTALFYFIFFSLNHVIGFTLMSLFDFVFWGLKKIKWFDVLQDKFFFSIAYFFVLIWYRIKILKIKFNRWRGKELDKSVIPTGKYCFNVTDITIDGHAYIKWCPYYGPMKEKKAACFYTGCIYKVGSNPQSEEKCKVRKTCKENYTIEVEKDEENDKNK